MKRDPAPQDELADFFDHAAIPMHCVDRAGIVVRANQAELDLLGYERDDYVGKPIAQFHADPATAAEILARLQAGETLREYPARLRARDGTTRDVRITSNVKWNPDGSFSHTRCVTRDLTALRPVDEEMRNRLAAIVASSDDAIVSKSLDGQIETWNSGAERIFGYSAAEAIGKSITLIIPEELRGEEQEFVRRLRLGERIDHYETVRVAKDGRRVEVSLTISPVRDAEGRIVGASKVGRDITARKQAEHALREADRRKDEFLAVLAHELRNPLAPIRNSLDLLKLPALPREHADKALSIIDRQVHHMVRLVDDLLEISRINRGRVELRTEGVDVGAVVAAAIETSRPLIDAARHELTLRVPPGRLTVNGDFVRLAQIISNLVNNAAKYTDPGGSIEVGVRRDGAEVLVEVRDNGIGIEPALLAQVFEMFTQGAAPGRSRGGLGIGLGLARSLTVLHGGRLDAASEGAGKGSLFTLRLPLAAAAIAPPPGDGSKPGIAPAAAQRILVVDDNVDAADALTLALARLGHAVQTVHDGASAVRVARLHRPQIVILDIGMPDMDGLEVARRMRQEPSLAGARFVALSGFGRSEDVRRSKEVGFDEHLIKPVSAEVLELVIAHLSRPDANRAAA